ncbi:hypothetical protein ACLMAL_31280 [Nocardia sp. CWNU-33]|uniref:hypothetical protein n=1 Tax=Nocardia sp. CWNU-33 TaxID=3392117 RepID=UPI00398EB5BB
MTPREPVTDPPAGWWVKGIATSPTASPAGQGPSRLHVLRAGTLRANSRTAALRRFAMAIMQVYRLEAMISAFDAAVSASDEAREV